MRILIVEDEPRIAAAIRKGLEQERYAVDVARTGSEGFDLASTEPYSLIVLDRMLPNMDGAAVCRKLRAAGITIPILMLTALGGVEDRVQGLDAGADDYLPKPFAFEEFLARVRALIRRPPVIAPRLLRAGDIELDADNSSVLRSGVAVQLTAREFALLEFLLRNAGKVLSKQKIIEHVWQFDADILPNTVEVFIRSLRGKLEAPFPNLPRVIRTVRGFGYTIDP